MCMRTPGGGNPRRSACRLLFFDQHCQKRVAALEEFHHAIRHQCFAVEACDEALAEALLPVVESVLKILHEKNAAKSGGIARNQKSLPFPKGQQTLSVMGPVLRLASF